MGLAPHEREQEIFHACLALTPPERGEYLHRTCQDDPELQERIERLLAAHERAEKGTLHPLGELPLEDLPDVIGPYRLTGVLGEGGMGVVYEAEQLEPVRRRVALKIVKLGMDTRQVVARFLAERQALASLDHPYVAKVFEAGQTVSGRPYFVMERVDGVPLVEYCDRQRLGTRRRVELLSLVCQAVQHAHQKGVIHRDLKPSNVLVASGDGGPLPKIIDFGIAKAVAPETTHTVTDLTRGGAALGTPAYMSPEQAGRGGLDVDTRTDVYSLGVILYEVLSGCLPTDPSKTGHVEYLAALASGDVHPARPSARAETEEAPEAAARRGTTPAGLRRQLEGDLDWICMKALEVDRTRRYDTAAALADDLKRHLGDEPVLAGPPSRTYRLRRMVRRNRTMVAAAAVAVVALVAGAAIAATQAVRATRAERTARADAETARQVSDFMVGLFEVSDPGKAKGSTVTARELLDRGAGRIGRQLADQPLVRARVQSVIGDIYRKLGLYEPAGPLLEESLAAREKLLGPQDREVVRSLHALGRLQYERGDKAAAEGTFRTALARVAAAPRPDRAEEARLRCELASVLRDKAQYKDSEALYRQGVEGLARELGPEHEEVGSAWVGLGSVLHFAGRYPEAETAYRNAVAILEKALDGDHPDLGAALGNLATTLGRVGKDAEAEQLLVRAVGILERASGPKHLAVAQTLNNLASQYGRQGRLDEALALQHRSLAIKQEIFGPDHPEGVLDLKNIGLTNLLKADYAAAQQAFERNLAVERKAFGPDHHRVFWTEARMGGLHLRLDRLEQAEAAYRRAVAGAEKTLGPDHFETASYVRGLAEVALRRGRLDEADALMARVKAASEKTPGNPEAPGNFRTLATLRTRQGRLAEALQAIDEALALQRKALRPGHPSLAEGLVVRADVLAAQGKNADAEALCTEAVATFEKALGPQHPDTARGLHCLGALQARRGARDEAAASLARAHAIREARLGKAHPDTLATARLQASLRPRQP